jgi:hypothetical protein
MKQEKKEVTAPKKESAVRVCGFCVFSQIK